MGKGIKELVTELRISKGNNTLIFIVTDERTKKELYKKLIKELNILKVQIEAIHLSEKNKNLPSILDSIWKDTPENTVFFVDGIENAFPEILGYLNLHREIFYEVKRPVVIWCSDYWLNEIAKKAPDFWDFRSNVYEFKTEKIAQILSEPMPIYISTTFKDLEEEDENKIKESIIISKHLLKAVKEDYKKASLYISIALNYGKLGDFEKAILYFKKGIKIKENLKNNILVYFDYVNFGNLYNSKGKSKEA
ncbi:MAG: hypothetical protein ACE5WD_14980, partial [Candidatus Aminicenantia bacterium]